MQDYSFNIINNARKYLYNTKFINLAPIKVALKVKI